MKTSSRPIVFISHSHEDKDQALKLNKLLSDNGAQTFLDQDNLYPGTLLTSALNEGVEKCNIFLLLWSNSARNSYWVTNEWKSAFESKKRIIPYLLEDESDAPLPEALYNFININISDQKHGHSELLRAIFGKIPDEIHGVDLYAGKWVADIDILDGSGSKVEYKLELRANGQVQGSIKSKSAGILGAAIQMAGMDGLNLNFMTQKFPVSGTWSMQPGTIYLNLIQSAYGQQLPINIEIHPSGHNRKKLVGTGPGGSKFVFRRKN